MNQILQKLSSKFDKEKFQKLNEEMSFSEYLDLVYSNPKLARTAYQYLYDMITSKGSTKIERYRKTYVRYKFFDNSETPIFGLDETLHQLVQFFKGAAGGYGPERRVLLLHGPVGSSKSTILRCIKKGLERYSLTDEGAWYTFKWVNLPTGKEDGIYTQNEDESPMHEDPLKLLPPEMRKEVLADLNKILFESTSDKDKPSLYRLTVEGDLDPRSKKFMQELLLRNNGDWGKVVENHIKVVRKIHSEADRCGIATFQPKDEKNQDSTELTGDINWGKLPHFGSDSDARSFNFDGEFCFPSKTPVRMADGSEKNIEEVNVGDEVVTHSGKCRKVLNTMNRTYSGKMVTLTVSHFPFPLTMTEDHPVAVVESSQNWRWVPGNLVWKKAKDLTNEDRVLIGWRKESEDKTIDLSVYLDNFVSAFVDGFEKVRIPTGEKKNAINRFVPVTHSLARLFGLYLAEGCCTTKKVVFNLSHKEQNLASEIISLVKAIFGANATQRLVNKNKTGRIVEINNVNLAKVFKGMAPGLAGTKRVPPIFMCASESVKTGLLSGWLDGDGHKKLKKDNKTGKYSVSISGTTISENMSRDISVMFLSSGMVSSVYTRPEFDNHKKAYVVGASGEKTALMFQELHDKAKSSGIKFHKSDSKRTEFGYARKVKSIQFSEVVNLEVFDIEVEEDHSFLANDIVVHNCVGSRGIVEFIEVLKLAKEFLYDLLGASQEKQIKPKKFPQVTVDTVLIGHTNSPEFLRLKSDQTMEALRDRTVKIDVPYLLRWSDELNILEHQYNKDRIRQHIAPHTLEIAALWSVLTRLQDDKDGKISLVEKAKLYDGRNLPGWTEDSVKELRDKYPEEGMIGISCRYTQDKISNCLSSHYDYINFFMVLNELKAGIDHQSLLNNEEDKSRYVHCIDLAKKELDEILKSEVQKALVGDEHAIERLCSNYIDNVMAYINGTKIKNPFTEQDQEPDERLMRSIEEKIDIPEVGADDFRRMLAGFIGHLAHNGKQFKWDSNPQLKKALEAKLFEDTKDHIKLSALNIKGTTVVDKEIQEKIDAVKQRLIKNYGYNEQSATDVLDYCGSIFARGDVAEED
jgi:predicted Ser/Thr protein kinase/intein/homing endonuclease